MEDERVHTISIKIPEDTYEQLKTYAEAHHKNMSDVLRELINGVLAGQPLPGPGPSPHPSPPPEQVLPAEIAELPGKFQEMLNYETQLRQYVVALTGRVGELQNAVVGILAVMFPGAPLPPWALMGAVDQIPGLTERAGDGE